MTEPYEQLVADHQRRASDANPVGSKATVYVVAIIALAMLTLASILGVLLLRPPPTDNTSLIATIVGITTPIIVALLGGAVQQVHLAVNGRLTQLLEQTAAASHAKGALVEKEKSEASAVVALAAAVAATAATAAASAGAAPATIPLAVVPVDPSPVA